jgi:hypothetical protein
MSTDSPSSKTLSTDACQHCGKPHPEVPPCRAVKMIAAAALASELYDEDDLERFAEEQRRNR